MKMNWIKTIEYLIRKCFNIWPDWAYIQHCDCCQMSIGLPELHWLEATDNNIPHTMKCRRRE